MTATPVPQSKINATLADPGQGEHLWICLAMYKVGDNTIRRMNAGEDPGTSLLDHENLLTVEGAGCFKCEQPYSKFIAHRKCTGSMEELV